MGRTRGHRRVISFQISWILGRIHVATPYSEVAEDILERLQQNPASKLTRHAVARVVTDALIQHRRNRAQYADVMRHRGGVS